LGKEHNRRYALIRLNITAEGFSEEKFVSEIIRPHLLQFNIYTDVRKVLTNRKLRKRGGIVGYLKFRNDVSQWIKEQPAAYHSTFIDLYGLSTDFPEFNTSKGINPYSRVTAIELGIANDINHPTFIPYIQLHEYESLLFTHPEEMETWLSLYNKVPIGEFNKIVQNYGGNPELINEGPETAPSKRLLSLCPVYDKVDDGILILKEIGLDKIRLRCSHFNQWITTLELLSAQ
jgi:hypothetical protein